MSTLAPPADGKPSRPSIKSAHSDASTVHQQQWAVPVTLESLDNEGVIQLPANEAADVLYRLDDAHQALVAHEGEGEGGDDELEQAARAQEIASEQAAAAASGGSGARDDSAHWNRLRHESRMGRKWWKRPNPYWLLLIQIGHAVSMGSSIAPKSEIYNSLACLVHYPSASDEVTPPVHSEPALPSVPRPLPAQPSNSLEDPSAAVQAAVSAATSPSPAGSYSAILDGLPLDPVKCRKSPEVQRAAAQFTTAMTITQGVLSALTTGWWGRLSDRFGRTRIMAVAMSGLILSDIIFLITAKFPHSVPGGYRFLLIGPVVDGLLGGMPTMGATNNAYIADCTPDGTRAQIYSRFMGVMMLGLALGPVLGSVVIRKTSDVLSVFYFSTALHTAMFLVVLLFLPESLSRAARSLLAKHAEEGRVAAKARDAAERRWEGADDADADEADADEDPNASGWSRRSFGGGSVRALRKSRGTARRAFRRAFAFLSPLEIFLPGFLEAYEDSAAGSKAGGYGKGRRRDWNLTLFAIGNAMVLCLMGIYQVKFQYIQLKFGWGPAELGPFLSALGSFRALHLLLILPALVRWLKPKVNRPSVSRAASPSGDGELAADPHAAHRALHDSRFDLRIIQLSLLVELAAYLGMVLASGSTGFLAATALTPFGGGAGPAMASLALALLPSTRIAGRLFGALAVLQAVFATVLGPLVFGLTYAATTRVFPKAVFVLCAAVLAAAFGAFALIRLESPDDGVEGGRGREEHEPLLAEVERGRQRRPKHVNGSGFSLRTPGSGEAGGSSSISRQGSSGSSTSA